MAVERTPDQAARYRAKNRRNNRSIRGRYAHLLKSAERRGIPCSITREEYGELLTDAVCHYCEGTLPEAGAGLDRRDNSRGYHLNNVVPCCSLCNLTKGPRLTYWEYQLVMVHRKSRQQS